MKTLESDLAKYEKEEKEDIYFPKQKIIYTDKRFNILKYINNLEVELQFIKKLGQFKEDIRWFQIYMLKAMVKSIL